MIAMRIAAVLAALVLLTPFGLRAQQDSALRSGARVRVTAPNVTNGQITGSLVSIRDSSLVLPDGDIPLASITALEVSRVTKSHAGTGALTGFVIGALGGVLIVTSFCTDDFFGPCTAGQVVGSMAVMTLPPTLLGAFIGALIRTERWEEVPLSEIRIGPSQHAGDGISVSASIAW